MSRIRLIHGDCRAAMRAMPEASVDAIVCDPPYHLTTGKKGGSGPASVNLDSPYGRARVGTGFMGMVWDGGDTFHDPATWREALRVLKPGGHLLAFGGSRTFHRLAVAIEDAGFELRDTVLNMHEGETVQVPVRDCPWLLAWTFGQGFPKSKNVAMAIDDKAFADWLEANPEHKARLRAARSDRAQREAVEAELRQLARLVRVEVDRKGVGKGNGRGPSFGHDGDTDGVPVHEPITDEAKAWAGWGTALKPAFEPIVMARKPLDGNVAENVLAHGTGAINIDAGRVPVNDAAYARNHSGDRGHGGSRTLKETGATDISAGGGRASALGRWPANVIHDGSDAVVGMFPSEAGASAPVRGTEASAASVGRVTGERDRVPGAFHADSGSAARFFWCPKTSRRDRNEGLEGQEKRPLNWSSGTQSPGTFQSEGAERAVENNHPTVKPTELMRYLLRLVVPPGGTVLDITCGSGSTLKAAAIEGFDAIGCDTDAHWINVSAMRAAANAPLLVNITTETAA